MLADNDVVKALEKALNDVDAPIGEHWGCGFLTTQTIKDTLDLINRQRVELIETRRDLLSECYRLEKELATAKTKAYKEFAERLKHHFWSKAECDILIRGEIDKILTELTERKEDEGK